MKVIIYCFILVLMITNGIVMISFAPGTDDITLAIIYLIYYSLLLFILVCISCILLHELKVRYHFEYKQQSRTIIVFLCAETFSLVLYIIFYTLLINGKKLLWFNDLYSTYYGSASRTTIQALGFIHLKKSRDPMVGLQKLESSTLMSNVQ